MKNNNPVYQTIYMHLRDQIVNGELLPGQILPSENELCRRFSTTRETVRRGLTQLTQEGLVYSRPKRGYFVSEPKNNDLSLTISPKITESISRFKDIRLIRPNIELQNALQIPSDQRIIAIYRGSYRDEFQVGLEIKYLPYDKVSHPSKTRSTTLFFRKQPMPKQILSVIIRSWKSQLYLPFQIFFLFWNAKKTNRFC